MCRVFSCAAARGGVHPAQRGCTHAPLPPPPPADARRRRKAAAKPPQSRRTPAARCSPFPALPAPLCRLFFRAFCSILPSVASLSSVFVGAAETAESRAAAASRATPRVVVCAAAWSLRRRCVCLCLRFLTVLREVTCVWYRGTFFAPEWRRNRHKTALRTLRHSQPHTHFSVCTRFPLLMHFHLHRRRTAPPSVVLCSDVH